MREYRVTWQRENQKGKRHALYQTLRGAKACARRQLTAHDEIVGEPFYEEPFNNRPKPITFGPIIEVREVGEWTVLELKEES